MGTTTTTTAAEPARVSPRPVAFRWERLAPAVVAVGVVLRIRQLLVDRSLWVDEALLAQNILDRDLGGLVEPLGGEQGAPVGYLWLLRMLVVGFGPTASWMRLPSLVAGVVLLPLVWVLARRLLPAPSAVAATAMVAISPGLIRYSVELKQYSLDVALAVALVLLAHVVVERRSPRSVLALTVFGACAVWLSHAAVLVLAGVGLFLFLRALAWRDAALIRAVATAGLVWGGVLIVLYLVSLRDLTENEFLTDYWRSGFPTDPLRPDRQLAWLWSSLVDLLGGVGGHPYAAIAVVALVVAAGALVARRRTWELVLLLSFLPALTAAASLQQYPFRGRLALFTLPFVLIVLASLLAQPSRGLRVGAAAVLALVSLGPLRTTLEEASDPTLFPDARSVVEFVAQRHEPHQEILVHKLAVAPFDFYRRVHGLPRAGVVRWRSAERCRAVPPEPLAAGYVWVVFAYTHSSSPPDEASIMRSQLDAMGRRLALVEAHDAFAALYDLGAPPTDPEGSQRMSTPSTACLFSRPV